MGTLEPQPSWRWRQTGADATVTSARLLQDADADESKTSDKSVVRISWPDEGNEKIFEKSEDDS